MVKTYSSLAALKSQIYWFGERNQCDTKVIFGITSVWKVKIEPSTYIDWIMGLVQNSEKVTRYDNKQFKNAVGYNSQNVIITSRIIMYVWILRHNNDNSPPQKCQHKLYK